MRRRLPATVGAFVHLDLDAADCTFAYDEESRSLSIHAAAGVMRNDQVVTVRLGGLTIDDLLERIATA